MCVCVCVCVCFVHMCIHVCITMCFYGDCEHVSLFMYFFMQLHNTSMCVHLIYSSPSLTYEHMTLFNSFISISVEHYIHAIPVYVLFLYFVWPGEQCRFSCYLNATNTESRLFAFRLQCNNRAEGNVSSFDNRIVYLRTRSVNTHFSIVRDYRKWEERCYLQFQSRGFNSHCVYAVFCGIHALYVRTHLLTYDVVGTYTVILLYCTYTRESKRFRRSPYNNHCVNARVCIDRIHSIQ